MKLQSEEIWRDYLLLVIRIVLIGYILGVLGIFIVIPLSSLDLTWTLIGFLLFPMIFAVPTLILDIVYEVRNWKMGLSWSLSCLIMMSAFTWVNQDTIRDGVALYIKPPKSAQNYQSQRREIETFIIKSLPCDTSLDLELRGVSPLSLTKVIAGEGISSGEILTSTEIRKDLYRTTFQSRIPNITVESLIGIPKEWNGSAIIFIHGLDLAPEQAFEKTSPIRVYKPYTEEIGLRLLEEGYMVVAPFVFSDELWTQNARFFSQYSYHGVDFMEVMIAKMMSTVDYLELQGIDRIGVYGISWGATIAREWASIETRVDVFVVNGNDLDPLFRLVNNDLGFRNNNPYHFETPQGLCTPTVLATLLEIAPTPLILEYGETDAQAGNIDKSFRLVADIYEGDIFLNRFERGHHINPGSSTINLLGVYLK